LSKLSLVLDLNSVADYCHDDDIDSSELKLHSANCKYYECHEFAKLFSVSKSPYFSFLHLNIGSLSKHFDEFNALLALLQHKFGVIGISETRFLKRHPTVINFDILGYSAIHTPTESSAGGTLLYISNTFSYRPRTDLDQCMYLSKQLESVFAEIILPKKTNVIVGCIYRHPNMSITEFNSFYLTPLLDKVGNENKKIFLLGDFNINLLKSNENNDISSFLDCLGSHLILPQILLPTRVTEHSKTLIDNIYSSVTEGEIFSGNLLHTISDHLPQFCIVYSQTPHNNRSKAKTIFYQNWSKFNQEQFILDFLEINWNETFTQGETVNPDCCFDTFNFKMQELVGRHLPTVRLTKRQLKTRRKPWITSAILKSMSKRDFYFRKFVKAKDESVKIHFHTLFKRYRNVIVKLSRRSKSNHFSSYFKQYSRNTRKIWEGVRNLISIKPDKSQQLLALHTISGISSDPLIIANTFNNYFTSIANSIRSNIPFSPKPFSSYLHNPNLNSVFLSPVTSEEVSELICSLSSRKSSGPNSLPVKILKLLHRDISKPISFI